MNNCFMKSSHKLIFICKDQSRGKFLDCSDRLVLKCVDRFFSLQNKLKMCILNCKLVLDQMTSNGLKFSYINILHYRKSNARFTSSLKHV